MSHLGKWWHRETERFRCELCPRGCLLSPGQRGFCFVREATERGIELSTYGRSSGFCLDPIEKKPLHHFLPGTSVFSLGTAGCNLGCRFCQNWDISTAKDFDTLADRANPVEIAQAAQRLGCKSVAFTYNDPIIFAEYAIDAAREARALGLSTVAVTNGYISPGPREELFDAMDAANIDLKSFSDDFYRKICVGRLQPVLETIEYVANHTETWLELTTLLIPGLNDSEEELTQLSEWVAGELGVDVPLHFSAFFPAHRLKNRPHTPLETLERAREIAMKAGLRWVYTGNVHFPLGESTWCPCCGTLLIERSFAAIESYYLDEKGACLRCGEQVPGRFTRGPGAWGNRTMRVRMPEGVLMH